MRFLKLAALAAVAALCLCGPAAHAGDLAFTWTAPSTNTDGSAIPASGAGSISGYVLEWGTCTGTAPNYAFGSKLGSASPAGTATAYTVTGLAPGLYCGRIAAVNTYATVSGFSAVVSKTIAAPVPNPPVLTVATLAFELRAYSGGTLRFVQVGTVPLGAPCGAKLAAEYYMFDGARLSKPTSGGAIAARCGA